jgi:hypothetical protein
MVLLTRKRRRRSNVPDGLGRLLLRLEPLDLAGLLPELDGVTVDQALRAAFGFLVVGANDRDPVRDMSVVADDVGVVSGQYSPDGS